MDGNKNNQKKGEKRERKGEEKRAHSLFRRRAPFRGPQLLDTMATTWVQCDKCALWRRIPVAIAETLDESTPW